MIFFISYKTPKWIGVYWSNKHDYGEPVGASSKHLRFNVQWSIGRHFAQIYCVTLLFFCGAPPIKIPLSALIGIVVGFIIYYFVYLGRTKFEKQKTKVAIFMASLISIASSVAFSSGCWYIQLVWGREEKQESAVLGVASFLSWLAGAALVHFVMYRNTLRKEAAAAVMPPDQRVSRKYKTRHFKPRQMKKLQKEMIEESNLEEIKQLEKIDKEDENGDQAKANGGNDDIIDMTSEEVDEDLEVPIIIDITGGSKVADGLSVDGDYEEAEIEEGQYESWCTLARLHCCGNAERSGERPDKTTLEKIVSVVKWFVWFFGSSLFLFLVIINIGATHQNKAVQENLPGAFDFLYPPDYNNGTVCAWDNRGPDSNSTTFVTAEAALAANFSIVHCGACAACSNWNDLRLQWTTRDFLADAAQDCAKKSLFGGEDAVQECNRDDVGFTDDCARCWTVDVLCAKKNCIFIFFQGVMINKLTNFQVGPNEITSATCDEAMCGPEFVPCSGATRRRMNIVSTIARPKEQQCSIVEEDWRTVFDHP
jgi:hypothetical protein